ncbi:MAG: CHAT domain-containing protein [Acidobacteria bacterium]|nr:CHAT domain-containing protein [Acidobacteriota bacterium]MBI3425336.1 CHAT domain-containing protein [Acidobacteriota bacterium]
MPRFMRFPPSLFPLWLLFLCALPAHSQTPSPQPLEPGKPVEKEIAGGQTHSYRINAAAGQCLRLTVEQLDADVALALFGAGEPALVELDFFLEGRPETLVWIAPAAGTFRLEIASPEKTAPRGNYRVTLLELRAATERDRQFLTAQAAFISATALADEKKPETRRQAQPQFEQALQLWRALDERLLTAGALSALGENLRALNETTQALDYFNQARARWHDLGDQDEEASTLSNLAALHNIANQKEQAIAEYQQALELYRALEDRQNQAVMLVNLGQLYAGLGQQQQARALFEQALPLRRDARSRALVLSALGLVYRNLGERRKALKFQQDALAQRRAAQDRDGEAVTLTNMGLIYTDLGEPQKALDVLNQALPLRRDPRGRGVTLSQLGRVYYLLGAPQEALQQLAAALPLLRAAKDQLSELDALNLQGLAHWAADDYPQALAVFEQALPLARELKARQFEAAILNNFGRVYASQGNQRQALAAYQQALPIARELKFKTGEAAALNNLGFVYEALGEPAKARDQQQQAVELAAKLNEPRREAKARYGLARLESTGNRLDAARKQMEKTLKLVETQREKLTSPELRADYRASVQQYYDLYIDVLMRLHRKLPKRGFAAQALHASEQARARGLLELLTESGAEIRAGVDTTLLDRERELQEQVSAKAAEQLALVTSGAAAAQLAPLTQELERLNGELRTVQSDIRTRSPRYAALTQPQPLKTQEIQRQLLTPDTLLLEYALGEERSYVWALSKTTLHSYTLPKRGTLEEAARRFYRSLTARNQASTGENPEQRQARLAAAEREIHKAGAALSKLILAPVAAQLGAKRLLIVADGALQYVPFAALNFAAAAPLLVKHEIVTLPSASTLAVLRAETKDRQPALQQLLVLADPVFEAQDERVQTLNLKLAKPEQNKADAPVVAAGESAVRALLLKKVVKETGGENAGFSIPRLPYTRQEAEAILALVPAEQRQTSFDFKANRAAITGPALGQTRLIHLATHGFLNSLNPELSGLVLSLINEQGAPQNGYLLAPDLYNLKLDATELVVLSACQTGLGKEIRGEGLTGLTRGLMYAGAPRVVASLWSVSDQATAELMKAFYQGMLTQGLRPAAALRAAQLTLWRQKQRQSPYYWAAFTLQGEWR